VMRVASSQKESLTVTSARVWALDSSHGAFLVYVANTGDTSVYVYRVEVTKPGGFDCSIYVWRYVKPGEVKTFSGTFDTSDCYPSGSIAPGDKVFVRVVYDGGSAGVPVTVESPG